MAEQDIAAAWQRAESVLRKRPDVGLHDDAPAAVRWSGGARIVASHPNGTQVQTDMPRELGGTGDRVTPGWLFRAALASCAATRIAMAAAAAGIELRTLELQVNSRSDTRGLLGMVGVDGEPVRATPRDVQLRVLISAQGVPAERLRELVETSTRCSPVPCAVQDAVPLALHIEVVGA